METWTERQLSALRALTLLTMKQHAAAAPSLIARLRAQGSFALADRVERGLKELEDEIKRLEDG